MRWRTSLALGAVAGFAAGLIGVTMVELTQPAQAIQPGPITVDLRFTDAMGRIVTAKTYAGRWLLLDLDLPGCACDRQARLDAISQAMKLMGRRSRDMAIVAARPDAASAPIPVSETTIDTLSGEAAQLTHLREALVVHDPAAPLLVLLHADGGLDRTIEGPIDGEQLAKDLLKFLTRGY